MDNNEMRSHVGREFKHNSPLTGLSDWTDTVREILPIHCISLTGDIKTRYVVKGQKHKGYNHYRFENVVFVD